NAYGNSLGCKFFDDGDHTGGLHPWVDADGAGAGRLASDVDDRCAVGDQRQALFHSTISVQVAPAIRERVVGDVHHPHDLDSRPAHLRSIRSSASDRDALLDLNCPRTADVVVITPALR